MRLIDADALLEKRRSFYEPRELESSTPVASTCVTVDDIYRAPTIDAAPVVHARWLTSSDIPDRLICSLCGRRFDMYHFDQKDMPFCLCGAKMDGGVADG